MDPKRLLPVLALLIALPLAAVPAEAGICVANCYNLAFPSLLCSVAGTCPDIDYLAFGGGTPLVAASAATGPPLLWVGPVVVTLDTGATFTTLGVGASNPPCNVWLHYALAPVVAGCVDNPILADVPLASAGVVSAPPVACLKTALLMVDVNDDGTEEITVPAQTVMLGPC